MTTPVRRGFAPADPQAFTEHAALLAPASTGAGGMGLLLAAAAALAAVGFAAFRFAPRLKPRPRDSA